MANFVLVHGSWAGGWEWSGVREILEEKGHRVLAPSLTGMADRHHLISEEVGLHTHIDDVARLIEWEQLDRVVLAGHSYGGMVITGVAPRVKKKLAHLVYVDAFLPRTGECAWDILTWQPEAFETLKLDDKPWQVKPVDTPTFFPELEGVNLFDYKVRILEEKKGTTAKIRVLIESGDTQEQWGTVGVSENIIEASWQALLDSIQYKLIRSNFQNTRD